MPVQLLFNGQNACRLVFHSKVVDVWPTKFDFSTVEFSPSHCLGQIGIAVECRDSMQSCDSPKNVPNHEKTSSLYYKAQETTKNHHKRRNATYPAHI